MLKIVFSQSLGLFEGASISLIFVYISIFIFKNFVNFIFFWLIYMLETVFCHFINILLVSNNFFSHKI